MIHCLIFEQDAQTRKSVGAMIEDCGLEPIFATSVLEGLTQCYDNMPEIIICNIALPDFNGDEFLSVLRSMPNGHDPYVIFSSDAHLGRMQLTSYLETLRDGIVRAAFG